jgi:hypothetical protein
MADIGTVIIGRSSNGGGRSSPFVDTGFDIAACLPFFLVGVAAFGLIIPFLNCLINFWAFSSLIYNFPS